MLPVTDHAVIVRGEGKDGGKSATVKIGGPDR